MPSFDPKTLLKRLACGQRLAAAEIATALDAMTDGQASTVQMGAFLIALATRGETPEELAGASSVLRRRMIPVEAPADAVDIVGTGGDGHHTYNVSTCAALVAAGAGVPIAKHGNRSVSSLSGASDVLAALGVKLEVTPETISRAIREAGCGFMWAPLHHPAMKVWAPVRAELGCRTIFNLLGPISNPARVTRQLLGVFDRAWLQPMAETLLALGSRHAWVVTGADGMDEITTTGVTHVMEVRAGAVRAFEVTPEDVGLSRVSLDDLKGGDAAHNAAALKRVLSGEASPYRDIVLMNAGAAIVVGGKAESLGEGVAIAGRAIDSGAAAQALERLVELTRST